MSTSDDLQNALDCLYLWAIKWQLQINFDKCKTLRISKAVKPMEPKKFYNINTEQLELVSEAKDLGLTVDSHLKFDKHVAKIVHTVHQRAALILKCFESRDKDLLMRAFCTYVRPLLEYATPAWSPHFSYLVFRVENVQRSFTKRLEGLKQFSYIDRLNILSAETLEKRRLVLDLTYCYKLVNGIITCSVSLNKNNNRTSARGHRSKLVQPLCHSDTAKYFFSSRITSVWNNLPADAVQAKTTLSFRNKLSSVNLSRYLIVK
jgi:hypothetical protein